MNVNCAWCNKEGKAEEMHTATHGDGSVEYICNNDVCTKEYDNSRGIV